METTYVAPRVVELGTVAELTLNLNQGGHFDSNFHGQTGAILSGPFLGR